MHYKKNSEAGYHCTSLAGNLLYALDLFQFSGYFLGRLVDLTCCRPSLGFAISYPLIDVWFKKYCPLRYLLIGKVGEGVAQLIGRIYRYIIQFLIGYVYLLVLMHFSNLHYDILQISRQAVQRFKVHKHA